MQRLLFIFGLTLLSGSIATAQEKSPKYKLTVPEGWKSEVIVLPPVFAKEMTWKGIEDIRFAPGMFKANSDSFFSYTILFWLPGKQNVDAKSLQREFLRYYQGLAKAVSAGKISGEEFDVKFHPVKSKAKPEMRDGDPVRSFVGEMKWVEPFVTRKKQTLYLDVQSWYCAKAKRQVVFICVSPQEKKAAIWQQMHKIRAGFRCVGKK